MTVTQALIAYPATAAVFLVLDAAWLWTQADRLYRPALGHLMLERFALAPAAAHLAWQVATLNPADPANPLARFRSNRFAGALVAAACLVAGNA